MPFAEFGDLRTRYEISGEKQTTLVLSNSLGTDLSMWDPQMTSFARRFRILRYDTRGHGQSSTTPGDYTIAQLGQDVLDLLDTLRLDRIHFCGLSMGGMIGIWLGIHAPHRLHRLVLCNTAARIGTKEMWNARIEKVRTGGMKPVAAAVVERWFTPEFRAACPDTVAKARTMLETTSPAGYSACCAAIRDMDQRDGVVRIKTPTLVVYGARDPVTSAADARFLVDSIPGATKMELHAAHLSNVEQPEAFTESVGNFLSN